MWRLIVIAAALTVATGCVSTTPAFGGKTKAHTEFRNYVDQTTGSEMVEYVRDLELPAGVDVAGADAMTYSGDADGFQIGINQNGNASTQGQAQLMTQIAEIQSVQAQAVVQGALSAVIEALEKYYLPINTQKIQNDAVKDANKQANIDKLLNMGQASNEQIDAFLNDPANQDFLMRILERFTNPTPSE